MEQSYGKGTLVPTGNTAPSIVVTFRITQQTAETKEGKGRSAPPKTVVHSISAEAGQHIGLGDFDLLVGGTIVRLKHIANDPEWLVLSSNVSAIYH